MRGVGLRSGERIRFREAMLSLRFKGMTRNECKFASADF